MARQRHMDERDNLIMFPRLYDNQSCPLDGYEALTFRVLLNPTGAEKTDWFHGHLGIDDCAACAALGDGVYCADCALARERMGRAAVSIYGKSQVAGFDFTTPDAALATLAQEDIPDELLSWLFLLPGTLWSARSDDLKKKLRSPSTAGNS